MGGKISAYPFAGDQASRSGTRYNDEIDHSLLHRFLMRKRDLIILGLSSFWKQKLRTILTLLGVIIGCATLTLSLSVGRGVSKAIEEEFRRRDRLRTIEVFPTFDNLAEDISDVPDEIKTFPPEIDTARAKRLQKYTVEEWKRRNDKFTPKPLTPERLDEVRAIDHVVRVEPELNLAGEIAWNNTTVQGNVIGIPLDDAELLARIETRNFSAPDASEVIVHEYFLWKMGLHSESAMQGAIGTKVRITLASGRRDSRMLMSLFDADAAKLTDEELKALEGAASQIKALVRLLPGDAKQRELLGKVLDRKVPGKKDKPLKEFSQEYTIVGIYRGVGPDDARSERRFFEPPLDAEILLPPETATRFLINGPRAGEFGFNHIRVYVDEEKNVKPVVAAIKAMGLREFSLSSILDQVKTNVLLIGLTMDFIAIAALIVAAIGIMNTLLTAVLERTREIGIMKAVGATDRSVQSMFLIEGGLIGLIGGLMGLTTAYLVSLPADAAGKARMSQQTQQPPPDTLFSWPIWLLIGVPMFALVVTTLSGFLPARRAARIQPVDALRHE